jgi:diguanylate cyclase (GGDEF)-like protein
MAVPEHPDARRLSARADEDLREQLSAVLSARSGDIAADAAGTFARGCAEALSADYCRQLGALLLRGVAGAIADGRLDARDVHAGELRRATGQRSLDPQSLFAFAYLLEQAALDELSVDAAFGATTESWPLVVQLVRRASFDLLAAWAGAAATGGVVDALTTVYSRPMFDAVLVKELDRASRFGAALSLILFGVDRLDAIDTAHGPGVGDRILERIGILLRSYFRQHDWVARHADDHFAVLLTNTNADQAASLADRARATVEARLGFVDHRSQARVAVTLSGGVVSMSIGAGDVVDDVRLTTAAESALDRATRAGGNRLERVDGYSAVSS